MRTVQGRFHCRRLGALTNGLGALTEVERGKTTLSSKGYFFGMSIVGCIFGLGLVMIWGCSPTAGRDPDLDFSLIEGDCTINTVRFVKRDSIGIVCDEYFEYEFCLPEWMQTKLSASSPISTRRELQDVQFEPRSFCGCEQQGVQFCTHYDKPECIPCADIADRAACETSGLSRDQGERSCEWWCFDSYENPDPVPACGTTYKSRLVTKNVCRKKCSKCYSDYTPTPHYAIGQTVPCWEPKDGYSPGSPYVCGNQSGTCYKVVDPAEEQHKGAKGFDASFVAGVVLTCLPCLTYCLFFFHENFLLQDASVSAPTNQA